MALIRAVLMTLFLSACASAPPQPPSSVASPATLQPALSPLAPLLGCWRGTFDTNAEIHDERCFEPMLGGRYVRDTHAVLPTSYGGETIYFWDARSDALSFSHYASDGGMSSGAARADQSALVFDPQMYAGADGETLRMKSRWVFSGRDSFVVTTEVERDGAWSHWGTITYLRSKEGR